MEPRLRPIAAIFSLNTDLLSQCAAGLTDAQANHRLTGGGNSIAFLIAHVTDARHFIVDLLGAPIPNPIGSLLADVQSIEEVEVMPSLRELLDAWRTVSTHLAVVFEGSTSAELDTATPQQFPVPGGRVIDALTFLAQHDSYHLGQISFLRRQLGLPAVTYDRSESSDPG